MKLKMAFDDRSPSFARDQFNERERVRPEDVIGGRGRFIIDTPGNRHYDDLIDEFSPQHIDVGGSMATNQIQNAILSRLLPGSRMMTKYERSTNTAVRMTEKECRTKIGQAIRHRNRNAQKKREDAMLQLDNLKRAQMFYHGTNLSNNFGVAHSQMRTHPHLYGILPQLDAARQNLGIANGKTLQEQLCNQMLQTVDASVTQVAYAQAMLPGSLMDCRQNTVRRASSGPATIQYQTSPSTSTPLTNHTQHYTEPPILPVPKASPDVPHFSQKNLACPQQAFPNPSLASSEQREYLPMNHQDSPHNFEVKSQLPTGKQVAVTEKVLGQADPDASVASPATKDPAIWANHHTSRSPTDAFEPQGPGLEDLASVDFALSPPLQAVLQNDTSRTKNYESSYLQQGRLQESVPFDAKGMDGMDSSQPNDMEPLPISTGSLGELDESGAVAPLLFNAFEDSSSK